MSRTKTENLNSRDRSNLQNIFLEKLSNLTDSNIDIIENGQLKDDAQKHLNNIFNKMVLFRDNSTSFEKEFSWSLNSENKRASYFLCSMLKLILKSDDIYISNYPAINLAPSNHIKPKQTPSKYKSKENRGDNNNQTLIIGKHHFSSPQSREIKGQYDNRNAEYYLSQRRTKFGIERPKTDISKSSLSKYIKKEDAETLSPILEICPNINTSPVEDILDIFEKASAKLNSDSIECIKDWVITIGNIYTLTHKSVNEKWEIFTTKDKKLIDWLYKNLINKHSFISLEPAKNIEGKKLCIINIIDILYATHSEEEFDLEVKRIKDAFSRKKATTEKVNISLDRVRWEKLKTLAGGKTDAKAMTVLRKLIDEAYKDLHQY